MWFRAYAADVILPIKGRRRQGCRLLSFPTTTTTVAFDNQFNLEPYVRSILSSNSHLNLIVLFIYLASKYVSPIPN